MGVQALPFVSRVTGVGGGCGRHATQPAQRVKRAHWLVCGGRWPAVNVRHDPPFICLMLHMYPYSGEGHFCRGRARGAVKMCVLGL